MDHPLTNITTEYIMTLHAPLESPQRANSDLLIYNVRPGGWVKGPGIQGELIAPSADWLRIMPNGTLKLDVRLSVRADDGSIIFVTYTGRIVASSEATQRLEAGETLGPDELHFMTSPTFETTSKTYGWLNDTVSIGKIASTKGGDDCHVTYDIFAVR